jgi:hypothetical protein
MGKDSSDMVVTDGSLVDSSGRAIGRVSVLESYGLTPDRQSGFRAGPFQHLLKRNYVNGAACAIRRTAAQAALPLPGGMPHDHWLAICCALHAGISFSSARLYRYRQHGANVVGIGTSGVLHRWLGMWRHSHAPRQRELHIWRALDRLAGLTPGPEANAARHKVEWLAQVVGGEGSELARAIRIVRSALNGNYRRFSPDDALARDLISLIR